MSRSNSGSDRAPPSQVRWPRFWEGEAPAEPQSTLPARTEPRPSKFVGPGFGRAKLLLSRNRLCRLERSRVLSDSRKAG